MLPACRTSGEGFVMPTFDLVPSDVAGFMEALWECQSACHDCCARREPRAHVFDYMVGQLRQLARKVIAPMDKPSREQGEVRSKRVVVGPAHAPGTVAAVAAHLPASRWSWRKGSEGTQGPIESALARQRVTLGKAGLPERTVWLVINRTVGAHPVDAS